MFCPKKAQAHSKLVLEVAWSNPINRRKEDSEHLRLLGYLRGRV
jgi:hypothetical protein